MDYHLRVITTYRININLPACVTLYEQHDAWRFHVQLSWCSNEALANNSRVVVHQADPSGVYQPCDIGMMHECILKTKEQLKHYADLKGLHVSFGTILPLVFIQTFSRLFCAYSCVHSTSQVFSLWIHNILNAALHHLRLANALQKYYRSKICQCMFTSQILKVFPCELENVVIVGRFPFSFCYEMERLW